MQKFSLAFVCCLMLAFTACEKETLLETNQDLNPTNLTVKDANVENYSTLLDDDGMFDIQEAIDAELDVADSISTQSIAMKDFKKSNLESINSSFGTTGDICGTAVSYTNSCYYKYQIWNNAANLVVDLYFPSSVVGWRTDCYGKTCQYYVTPCIVFDLYNANGVKIGTKNVATSNIMVQNTRIEFNLSALLAQYPTLKCVRLKGFFYRMKKCSTSNNSGDDDDDDDSSDNDDDDSNDDDDDDDSGYYSTPVRIGTVCITSREFCLQQCQPVCPTVGDINLDKLKVCGSGAIKGTVSINGDASATQTIWTFDGQILTGNTVSIDLPLNSTCSVITKNVNAKVICTRDQSVLAERNFNVSVNPALTATISKDFVLCQAYIDPSCEFDSPDFSWTFGSLSGTTREIPLTSAINTLNFTITKDGCSYSGSEGELYCEPL